MEEAEYRASLLRRFRKKSQFSTLPNADKRFSDAEIKAEYKALLSQCTESESDLGACHRRCGESNERPSLRDDFPSSSSEFEQLERLVGRCTELENDLEKCNESCAHDTAGEGEKPNEDGRKTLQANAKRPRPTDAEIEAMAAKGILFEDLDVILTAIQDALATNKSVEMRRDYDILSRKVQVIKRIASQ